MEPRPQQNQNVYENFMQELELGDEAQWDEDECEDDDSSGGGGGSLERMEMMFEKEQGVVRRAGRLAFKPLISLQKERKLELVPRRKWRNYWVTLKGESERETLNQTTRGSTRASKTMGCARLWPKWSLLCMKLNVMGLVQHQTKVTHV